LKMISSSALQICMLQEKMLYVVIVDLFMVMVCG
jgi:hypothetical protein